MNLYLIRHADAGDRKRWEGDDLERPLSDLGWQQARALGQAFRRQSLPVDLVVSSPAVRTRETADGFLDGWTNPPALQFNDLLAPGEMRRRKLGKAISALEAQNIAIVGHDPDVPAFLGWLVGIDPGNIDLEKGAAAMVQFDETLEKGDGQLMWIVSPGWFLTAG
jgi:phosphohistidine phosphatase